MSGNHFDQLAQEILKQKQLMDKLEAENRELREQIADLRTGRGIFVDIYGSRFALRDESSSVQATSASPVPAKTSPLPPTVATSTPPLNQQIVDTPTTERSESTSQSQEPSVKEPVSPSNNNEDQKSISRESTFLEEMLVDEFASALTSSNAVWQGPPEKKPSKPQHKPEEPINEKEKEALRRELMGSFLLE